MVHGSRISLVVGLASTLLGAGLGGLVGFVSGYLGGRTDLVVQRLMDIMQALSIPVLALVLAAALGPSLMNTVIAISVVIAPRAARLIRSSVLAIREFVYIESARALGVSHGRVAFRHILPNTFGPFIVLVTAQLGGAILAEAALSFLGLGIPEPYPFWGRMLSIAAAEYAQKAPWLVIFPGVAISLAVFGTNLRATHSATRSTRACARAELRSLPGDILVGGRVGVPGDQAEAGLAHAGPDAAEEGQLPDRRVHDLLVDELLMRWRVASRRLGSTSAACSWKSPSRSG